MLNKIMIMGRLTADVELRSTQSGTHVATFTLAVDRDFRPQGGDRETDFINCVAWKGTADFVANYFSKGSMAVVVGRLQTRKYETQDGQKRTATEVIAESVYFGEGKKDAANNTPIAPSAAPSADIDGFMPVEEEDLPF